MIAEDPDYGIVRARFHDGDREYHYTCPEARIGDVIQAPGNSPALVVGFGRAKWTGNCRRAKVITRCEDRQEASSYIDWAPSTINDDYSVPSYADQDIKFSVASLNYRYLLEKGPNMNIDNQIKQAEAEIKRLKDEAKRRKEIKRMRTLAKDTLVAVCNGTDEGARVEAARLILDRWT